MVEAAAGLPFGVTVFADGLDEFVWRVFLVDLEEGVPKASFDASRFFRLASSWSLVGSL